MADAEARKRVHKQIEDKVRPLADAAFQRVAKAVPELAKAMKKVETGIKCEGPDVLQTLRRELIIKLRAVAEARGWALDALDELKKATADDEDFEADADEVEALQKKLTASRDLLADQIVKAKKLEDDARATIEKGDQSEKTAHREWDAMMTLFETQTAWLDKQLKEMRTAQKNADAAVKSRDQAALKAAKESVNEFLEAPDAMQGKLLLKRTNEFMSKYDLDTFSKDFLNEMAKDRATTVGEYDKRAQELEQEGKKIQDAVKKLEIEPPDAVKATAELGFKANFITRVRDALTLDESKLAKKLEEIAKDAGITATGKDLVEKLKRKKLL